MRKAMKFNGESYYSEFSGNKGLGKLPLTLEGPRTMVFLIKGSVHSEFLNFCQFCLKLLLL